MEVFLSWLATVGELFSKIWSNIYAVFEKAVFFCDGIFNGTMITIPLGSGKVLEISFLVILLVAMGVYFTIRTKALQIRHLPNMLRTAAEKSDKTDKKALSGWQALIVSTATRVGMGNLAGVVAAISVGGAGAVFWMWITALIGSATAFVEATLAQKYKQPDPLYGGYRGGPAYYIHALVEKWKGKKIKKSILATLFAVSGLICWCGISQVVGNSVTEAFYNEFNVKPIYTIIVLVAFAAVIVLRKNATVKVLDIMVPIMAGCFFVITVVIILMNITRLPEVIARIFSEAFGITQIAGGGIGAVIMQGVKRGLFSNEAGSGSAPCAAAAADSDNPAKTGLMQSMGVFIDTLVICSCTAFIMLLVPENVVEGMGGMALLQTAMNYHLGSFGGIFITVTLWLFAFSTFVGVLFYARSNIAYVFGDKMKAQTIYKVVALIMLFIGGIGTYTAVWAMSDVGIALMTVFNVIAIVPMCKESLEVLKEYEKARKTLKSEKKK